MRYEPTHQVFHAHESCPDCGGALGKPSVAYTRQVIDLPVVAAIITEHVVCKRYCVSCKTRSYPRPDLSSYVIGKQRVGINLMSLITTMREELRLPYVKIQQHLHIFYKLTLSEGEIIAVCQRTALRGMHEYEIIKKQLLASSYLMLMKLEDERMEETVTSGTSPIKHISSCSIAAHGV